MLASTIPQSTINSPSLPSSSLVIPRSPIIITFPTSSRVVASIFQTRMKHSRPRESCNKIRNKYRCIPLNRCRYMALVAHGGKAERYENPRRCRYTARTTCSMLIHTATRPIRRFFPLPYFLVLGTFELALRTHVHNLFLVFGNAAFAQVSLFGLEYAWWDELHEPHEPL